MGYVSCLAPSPLRTLKAGYEKRISDLNIDTSLEAVQQNGDSFDNLQYLGEHCSRRLLQDYQTNKENELERRRLYKHIRAIDMQLSSDTDDGLKESAKKVQAAALDILAGSEEVCAFVSRRIL